MVEYIQKSPDQPLNKLKKYEQGSWIIVTEPDRAELKKLATKFNLDKYTLYDILDPDEVPRIERIDYKDYLFVRFARDSKAGKMSTSPVLIIFNNDIMITVSNKPINSLNTLTGDESNINTYEPMTY